MRVIERNPELEPKIAQVTYRRAMVAFPDRIRVVYIRDVSGDSRDEEVARLIDEAREQEVEMLLVPDTTVAAEHAAELGLLDPAALAEIHVEKANDEQPGSHG